MHVVASRDIFVRYFTALYFLLSYGRTRIRNIINIYIYIYIYIYTRIYNMICITIIYVCVLKFYRMICNTHLLFIPTIKFPFYFFIFYVVLQKQAI